MSTGTLSRMVRPGLWHLLSAPHRPRPHVILPRLKLLKATQPVLSVPRKKHVTCPLAPFDRGIHIARVCSWDSPRSVGRCRAIFALRGLLNRGFRDLDVTP